MEDIASSQNKELVKGQMRVELGRFARSFAAKRKEPEKKRAVSQPPSNALTTTFDELVEEEAQPPGVSDRFVKQRIASRGSSAQLGGMRSLAAR